jgi:hypothetical protein
MNKRSLHWIQLLEIFNFFRMGFTLGELVPLVKVFRLFRLEWIFWGVQSVDTIDRDVQHLSYWQGQCVL